MGDIKLTPRMLQVAAMVPRGAMVADIGCDHAYIPIYLCIHRECKRMIAMDIRQGPLDIARANIHKAGLSDKIELRQSDGMEALSEGEADTLVLAGMGGLLMQEILGRKPELLGSVSCMVLQPQSEVEGVRRFVHRCGFQIVAEAMLWDKEKPYFVMRCETRAGGFNIQAWSDIEYRYGGLLLAEQNKGLSLYLKREAAVLEQTRTKLKCQDSDRARARLREIEQQQAWNEAAQSSMGIRGCMN